MLHCSRCHVPAIPRENGFCCSVCGQAVEQPKRVLECSSVGGPFGSPFSALVAVVKVYGKGDTIENHYQLSKRWRGQPAPTEWGQAKGKYPDYLEIGGLEVPAELMTAWYYLLWYKFLSHRPDLVRIAQGYDDFHDRFARKGSVSQADAVRLFVKEGPKEIWDREDVQRLVALLPRRSPAPY